MKSSWESPEVEVIKARKEWFKKVEVHSFEKSLSFKYRRMLLERATTTSSMEFDM
jgi:hypothetical protein